MWRWPIPAMLAAATVLGLSSPTHAASASIPDRGADLGTDVTQLDVTWDGTALTVSLTYADEPFSFAFDLLLSASVDPRDSHACDASDADSIAIRSDASSTRLRMPGIDGAVVAPRSWTGTTARYVFSSPPLAQALEGDDPRDPFTCVSGQADGDELFGGFAGKVLRLTPRIVRQALVDELESRYGPRSTHGSGSWLRCPTQELLPADDEDSPIGLCEFQFRDHGRVFRGGSFSAALVSGTVLTNDIESRRYTKALHRCLIRRALPTHPMVVDRTLRASGFVGCDNDGGNMIGDLHGMHPGIRHVRIHGTNTLGFEDRLLFRCVVRRSGTRYGAACRNRLGDGFRYGYALRRPKPKPHRAPARQCDPNYTGACLDPNASDYDCAGGSGDGPLYTGPVQVVGDDHYGLDADGDGFGCENS